MNRSAISTLYLPIRDLAGDGLQHWTRALVDKTAQVPDGQTFTWLRGDVVVENTALLYDAVMANVQWAQDKLQAATSAAGKQRYKHAIDAAKTYAYILNTLLPKYTFRPAETMQLPDVKESDIYGHYCLSRAIAYDAIGTADLQSSSAASIAAASNASHLYLVAAQLIEGDIGMCLAKAQINAADALVLHGDALLEQWQNDQNDKGACQALACFTEAHDRYVRNGHVGCAEKVSFASDRNQVHWMKPQLPAFSSLVRPRVTPI